jgi:hypothetical protein
MSRTTNKIIKGVALALLVGGVLAPSAGAAGEPQSPGDLARTPTEIGQAVGEPGEGTPAVQADGRESQQVPGGLVRTPTEIGQAVGEPGDPNVAAVVQPVNQTSVAGESSGFDWGDAAIGAGLTLILGIGAVAIVSRRRGSPRKLRTAVTSS